MPCTFKKAARRGGQQRQRQSTGSESNDDDDNVIAATKKVRTGGIQSVSLILYFGMGIWIGHEVLYKTVIFITFQSSGRLNKREHKKESSDDDSSDGETQVRRELLGMLSINRLINQ